MRASLRRFSVSFLLLFAAQWRAGLSRSIGAPVAACADMTQRHFGSPAACAGSDCPFSVSLVAIDGEPVVPGTQTYRCGSEHTLRVLSSDSAQPFRGFAVQGRESTDSFTNSAAYLGEFVSAPSGGDWKIWGCDTASATHTNPSDKTSVDLTWKAPTNFGSNVTMWFSITRTFSNFHAQLRGVELSPDPLCPPTGTLRFSCAFEVDGGDVVASSCAAEGFIPASFECQTNDQAAVPCTIPARFPLPGAGQHTLTVTANTFFPDRVNPLSTSTTVTINPTLDCSATSDQASGVFTVKCDANAVPEQVMCAIDGNPLTPCDLENIQISATDFAAGSSHVLEVSYSVGGLTSPVARITFTGVGSRDPLEANCTNQILPDQSVIVFTCAANREIASQECTLNSKPISDCKLPLSIAFSDLDLPTNVLEIVLSDANGVSATYRANIPAIPAEPFQANCSAAFNNDRTLVNANCTANREIETVQCTLNSVDIANCMLPLSIPASNLTAGNNALEIRVSNGGAILLSRITLSVPAIPFSASCNQTVSSDSTTITISCSANRAIASQVCSLNGEIITNCMLPLDIPVSGLNAGDNLLQLQLSDGQGSSSNLTITITVGQPPAQLRLSCNAGITNGVLGLMCVAVGGTVANVTCDYDNGDVVELCDLTTSVDTTRFEPGDHTLLVTAQTAEGVRAQAIINFNVPIPSLKIFCSVYAIPGRVDIQCDSSRELLGGLGMCSVTGSPTSVPCDIENFVVTDDFLPPGSYILTINATDVLEQFASIQVPFTLTAGVDQPGFRILSGNVLLGLKPELLDFAAPSGSVVSVAAADTPRTAIVQRNVNITVNCSEWFDENPGDNTYITQAPLDEMGNEVYFEYRLEPIVTDTRIIDHESVTFLNTYNDLGARDPDHSLLRCYSCMTSEDDLVTNCQSASVAVFVIGSAPEIDAAPQDETPTVDGPVTVTRIGADFCISFNNPPSALQITCNDANVQGPLPNPTLSWYKDDVLVFTIEGFSPVPNEEFYNVGNNGLLQFGVLEPPPLVVIPTSESGSQLLLNFLVSNVSMPSELPSGVDASDIGRELFSVLLGKWECRSNNTFGTDSAVTELTDCAVSMFTLDCTVSSTGLSGPLRLNCFGSRDIQSVECNYDNGEIVEACEIPIVVDFNRFSPGDHTLLVTATSIDGDVATHESVFTVPAPLEIDCEVTESIGFTNVACNTSKELLFQPSCSLLELGADPQDAISFACDLTGIILTSTRYPPGDYVLTITAIDKEEQTDTERVPLTILERLDDILSCQPLVGSRLLTIFCTSPSGVIESSTCSFDGAGEETCDLSSIEIDQFSFAPGPHVLLISFNLTSGESGTFEYDFVGEIREPVLIYLETNTSIYDIIEGGQLELPILTSGFSYGSIPLTVSLITYSEYMDRGFNLTDGFESEDLPIDAATAGEDFVAFSNTYNVNAGVPLPPVFFKVSTILDDITEYAEGFFIYFDIQEFNLDPRDVNQVSLDRDAYLIRIIDPSIFNRLELFCFVSGVSGTTTVTCTSSNPLQFPQQCSLDILEEPFDCNATSVELSIEEYPPGDYNFTVTVTDVFNQSVTVDILLSISGPELTCNQLFGSRLLTIGCELSFEVVNSSTCSFDNLPAFECDPRFIEIDQFRFSPGPHTLTIAYNTSSGFEGVLVYPFIGLVREPVLIYLEENIYDIKEGGQLELPILTSGFSYGSIPLTVSLITYSEYMDRGFNLTDGFESEDLPIDAATAGEDFVAFSNTYNVNAGVALPPVFFNVSTILDDITEYAEGFFIYFDIQEFNLDPRDVNQVSLDRDAYLIRIVDISLELFCFVSGVSGTTTVMCTSNNPLQFPQQCSLDILEEPFDCNATSVELSIEEYPPGDYNFTVTVTDVFNQSVTVDILLSISGPELTCNQLFGSRLLTIGCELSFEVVNSSTCSFDNLPAFECDPGFIEIDQFRFSPGPHTLTIAYNTSSGFKGVLVYPFIGLDREPVLIYLEENIYDIKEGGQLELPILTSGFSYGSITLTVSLITYSEYMDRGFNLTDGFESEDLPIRAATAGEDFVAFSNTYNVHAGVPLPPVFFKVSTSLDGLPENTEGFFIYFDIQEFNLDPRDVNQVSLARDAYLIRIPPGLGLSCSLSGVSGTTIVTCISNNPLKFPQLCSLDLPFDCNSTSVVLTVEDYPPGDYNITIIATDIFNQTISEVVPLFISEPLLSASCSIRNDGDDFFVSCSTSLDETLVPHQYYCSYDSGNSEACDGSFRIDLERFAPGNHSLVITISTTFGQVLVVPTLYFYIPGDREPTLQCFNVTNTRLLTFTCISPDGDIASSSCAFDRGPFSPCDLDFYEIDQYSFTPGTRVFTVRFTLTTGEEGVYQDTFEAFRREPAVFGLPSDNGLIDIDEGDSVNIPLLDFSGFSYGLVPIIVTTRTYSDPQRPPFDIAPTDPADEYDFKAIDTTFTLYAGGSILSRPYITLEAYQDGISEQVEGFSIFLEIEESGLDPRDVGQVSISRIHSFVRINQSNASNFEVLIGEVELGQRPELIDVAAGDEESVRAFVSDDQQTAIVTDGASIRLDWLRWVDEVLGDSADNVTYTVLRTQLDESGNPVGSAQEFNGTDRISVQLDPLADEFYVEISDVSSSAGAEDPDRAIYELEACQENSDGIETCYTSNMTVFAVGPPLDLTCSISGVNGVARVMCESNNLLISPQVCSLGSFLEQYPCNITEVVEFTVQEYLPGNYNLTVEALDVFGQSVTEVVPFFLSEPILSATCRIDGLSVVCTSNLDSTLVPVNYICSYDSGDGVPCNSSFTIDQTRFTPGRHTLDITAETPFDQILVLATISFFIQGAELTCLRIPDIRLLTLDCSSVNGTIDSATCSIDGGPASPCDLTFYEIDQFSFSTGQHTVMISFRLANGREGVRFYNFTGEIRPNVTIGIFSDKGVVDISEGPLVQRDLLVSGFSYGSIPVQVTTFTYSEFAAMGYDITGDFSSDVLPQNAADAYDYLSLDSTMDVFAGNPLAQFYVPLEAYLDGVREGMEGFLLYLDVSESDLDPRDVGAISLERSVYLVRIADSSTSNFEILIGEVELGQRPELLNYTVGNGEFARAFVSNERQTAIVTDGASIRLDWLRWVNEVLDDSAGDVNYTVRRTQLDESGNPIGSAQEFDGTDRISVQLDPLANEFYVEISDVSSSAGAEDPDRAIYELEACQKNSDGSETCYTSNMTVYAIRMDDNPLELVCSTDRSDSGVISVSCRSSNPLVHPQQCSIAGDVFFCNSSGIVLSEADYLPGFYNFTVTATDVFGQSLTVVVPIIIVEPILIAFCTLDAFGYGVTCTTSLDATEIPLSYSCSYDGGLLEPCDSEFEIDVNRFETGLHTLIVTISTGQQFFNSSIEFFVFRPTLQCLLLPDARLLLIGCSSFPEAVQSATCSFDEGPATDCDPASIEIDQFTFSPGPHNLTIVFNTSSGFIEEFVYPFTGLVREPAVFTLSTDGIFDVPEGLIHLDQIIATGFSYGAVPISLSTLTYGEFAAEGYNLSDSFASNDIPSYAADEYDYESLDKTLTVYAGGFAPLDFFSLQSYLDGVRENLEGYVLYLEIIEADLDPRDAGQVSLARSVYLVRINQSAVSNFEILIGEVELGQRPELLNYTVGNGEFARAFVSDDQQTAIVTDGASIRLDWLRWVSEVLGDSAGDVTYTVRRTQLDESGNPIGLAQEFNGTDRIGVQFDPLADEFYVEISDVSSSAGAEDPDRAIYELEACQENSDGSETCYTSSMTVYAIRMDDNPLELVCSTDRPDSGVISVSCRSSNPLVHPQQCSIAGDVFSCNSSGIVLSEADYLPGFYNFTVTATDVFGQSLTVVVPIIIVGLSCSVSGVSGTTRVMCTSNNPLQFPQLCSLDLPNEPIDPVFICNASSVVLTVEEYLPGNYNFTVLATDVFDQSISVVVPVSISEPMLSGMCEFDEASLSVFCSTELDRTQVPLTYSCSYDNGTSEICSFNFVIDELRFASGPHQLTITISTLLGQELTLPDISFTIDIDTPRLDCSQAVGSRLLTIGCSLSTGDVESAMCSFDNLPAFECDPEFIIIDEFNFTPDTHTLTIVYNTTLDYEGEFTYSFNGRVREPGVFGIASALPEGVIDLAEGAALRDRVTATGFSYGLVSIRATVLTYDQFRAGGFDPSVVFDPIDVPEKAADVYDYENIETTLSQYAGGPLGPPEEQRFTFAYQDGIRENIEGAILYLEIIEADLDPRDVGNVSLARSAYLVRINPSDTSSFSILIGDVELGQRPELFDVVATERVSAFVSDERQTAIVTDGASIRLDWLRWVNEVLGDSAGDVNYTVRRTQLDESGNPIGLAQEFDGTDRISVQFDPLADEFYVEISDVSSSASPDRAIYELEACQENSDGNETCYTSSMTVYAIQPFDLFIDFKVLPDPLAPGDGSSRIIFLDESGTSSATISIEVRGGSPFASIPFRVLPLSYDDYEARYPNVNIDDIFPSRPLDPAGDSDIDKTPLTFKGPAVFSPSSVIPDLIPELSEGFIYYLEIDRANADPRDLSRLFFLNTHILAVIEDDDVLVTCEANVFDDVVRVSCPGIDGLPLDDGYQCSVDFSSPESCLFPFEIARSSLLPGRHNIRLFQRLDGEPIPEQIVGGTQFLTEPLSIRFVNDTPILGVDNVRAEFEINRAGVRIECHLTHLDRPRQDCSDGVFELSNIPPGDFTLRLVAVDPFINDAFNPHRRAITRNRLWVHGDDTFCVVHVRNDGVSVDENTMTIDFYSTGEPSGFLCSFDRGEFFECSSPYVRENIPIGRHRIKVVPEGCGRDFRGFTTRFDVL